MPNYTLIATVASSRDPTKEYQVKTDGNRLTCSCPRWRFARGGDANRSCRHTQEVQPRVDALGGIGRVLTLIRAMGASSLDDAIPAGAVGRNPLPAPARTSRPGLRTAERRATGSPAPMVNTPPPRPAPASQVGVADDIRPDWLGGRRAIILRD